MLLIACVAVAGVATAKPPKHPDKATAAERAKLLVKALRENKPDIAMPFFFPKDPFRKVKGIKNPDRYFDYMVKVYRKDIASMRARLKKPESVEFVSFELGWRKRWVKKWKEGNRLPYYATYKSKLVVKDAGKEKALRVRVMITWDGQWYCVHLLRMKLHEKL